MPLKAAAAVPAHTQSRPRLRGYPRPALKNPKRNGNITWIRCSLGSIPKTHSTLFHTIPIGICGFGGQCCFPSKGCHVSVFYSGNNGFPSKKSDFANERPQTPQLEENYPLDFRCCNSDCIPFFHRPFRKLAVGSIDAVLLPCRSLHIDFVDLRDQKR